jgi:hypothetical protein
MGDEKSAADCSGEIRVRNSVTIIGYFTEF